MQKPSNPEEYIGWWNKNFDVKIDEAMKKHYESACILVKYNFENSVEWNKLIQELYNCEATYRHRSGYDLLMKGPEEIKLSIKDWDNFISKVWRRNVVENKNWDKEDNEPAEGWITPLNWLERINDTVRTSIVVKYLDGVKLILDTMVHHYEACGCECKEDWEAREEGYYAAHLNVIRDYEIPFGFQTRNYRISVEIQVTTQMKDVIRQLTHLYYEHRRVRLDTPSEKWQWDYMSEEFAPNYIGHILHYVEGAIMEIRDRRQVDGKE
jgi:ppGpp synthetase/RelA/SpoT-type nucleotidyltranferase